ncbi:MarR family winged helix-turn-helix transcriptional regulator [Sulfitobacter mediterraneus]|uniref:MarR family winged helix-turn-helix transcriptional regulator n=1 Tax=Sulfitobacter mediterraneus TaxID=83219 RepID=UPI0021A5F494|nr:MarR family winged helix-turn-helix transcriptional regulator [Sulfitobacter mediterraneus]UWR09628.1 MarR family winged helix-turn-helix transcriptional regulator [Sulfitobacter mediterraneus]
MKFEKENSAGYLVNHMARLFAKGLQDRIAPLGIVIGQFPILLELWQKDGVSQRELLAKLDIEQATLANTLNRMERDGLIKRTKHPADARAQQIWLTKQALQLRDDAYQSAQDQNRAALGALNDAEQAQLIDFMRRIIAGLRPS